MKKRAAELSAAARAINGGLMKAGVNTVTISFGDRLTSYKTLDAANDLECVGGTPTGAAMREANNWLESQQATRALMIVITDGQPVDAALVDEQFQRCENFGGFVLGVEIENQWSSLSKIETQTHEHIKVTDVARLPQELDPKLAAFIAGR
jgi:nitric oxide reductase activation protein